MRLYGSLAPSVIDQNPNYHYDCDLRLKDLAEENAAVTAHKFGDMQKVENRMVRSHAILLPGHRLHQQRSEISRDCSSSIGLETVSITPRLRQ